MQFCHRNKYLYLVNASIFTDFYERHFYQYEPWGLCQQLFALSSMLCKEKRMEFQPEARLQICLGCKSFVGILSHMQLFL